MGLFDIFKKRPDPVPATPISFEVAGLFAHENEAKEIMSENPYLKKAKKVEGSKIFVLAPFEAFCDIVPEPGNPHDPNAMKVMVDGHHLGYIPTYMQERVVQRLKAGQHASVKLLGGNYRIYEDGEWVTYKNSLKGTVTIG